MLGRIENALGGSWSKGAVTEVTPFVYADQEGNIIVYYLCCSTYFDEEFPKILGLNIDAISTVIVPEQAESSRECAVNGCPAMIYETDGDSYLCWTISPEISCILEYDPNAEDEEDMPRMAESVQRGSGMGHPGSWKAPAACGRRQQALFCRRRLSAKTQTVFESGPDQSSGKSCCWQ